ncbi:hypothetical protein WH5701_16370 [Synechococcus sp. WH 5701]|nr:hypothetical protein WH5701_16370 [Synechococcus sp. WH 5701]
MIAQNLPGSVQRQHPLIIATRIRVVLFHQASISSLDFGR